MIQVYVDNGKKQHMIKSSLEAYGASGIIHITHFNKSATNEDENNYWLESCGLDSWMIATKFDLESLVNYLCKLGYTVKLW